MPNVKKLIDVNKNLIDIKNLIDVTKNLIEDVTKNLNRKINPASSQLLHFFKIFFSKIRKSRKVYKVKKLKMLLQIPSHDYAVMLQWSHLDLRKQNKKDKN